MSGAHDEKWGKWGGYERASKTDRRGNDEKNPPKESTAGERFGEPVPLPPKKPPCTKSEVKVGM